MSKLGGFFARKTGLYDKADEPGAATEATVLPVSPLELDEELFSTLGAQMGSENEQLRNLLIDASNKISELDSIRAAVDRLVEPVAKTLQAFEAEKSEKLSLLKVLTDTRAAYSKMRKDVGELERKAATAEQECHVLRQELATTQTQLRTAETTKAEISTDIAARRAQIADLESRLAQESGESRLLREENKRLDERMAASEKRVIALEADLNATRQRLTLAEDEKQAQHASFEKASTEAARFARKLAEAEAAFAAAQARLRHLEANFAEMSSERSRLAVALDEATERHEHEQTTQRMRFDTLQARAGATEKLLVEAREHLIARAEEIRDFDRRNADVVRERDSLAARVQELEAERHARETEHQEVEQARQTLMERGSALARAFTTKEAALARAEDTIGSLTERVTELEASLANEKQTAEQAMEELNTTLRRERMQRAVVEGALDVGRKDLSRLMREIAALKREQPSANEEPAAPPQAANAA